MDKKQLEEKLSEVAEWVYPSVSQDNAYERIIPWGGREYKHEYTPKPDMGPRVIRLRADRCLNPCEWCGLILNQQQNITKQITPRRGASPEIIKWHYSCQTCKKSWDPESKKLQPLSKMQMARKRNKLNTR
jgi:hypothetical protein